MAVSSSPPPQQINPRQEQRPTNNIINQVFRGSWTWKITFFYLTVMLFIPIIAMFQKAATESPAKFWEIATSPIALSAYEVTFVTAVGTALVNGFFGTLIAWVMVRYEFPFKRIIDASIDLPFALPTSVAGLTLATVYSDNGWVGSLLPFKVSFTRTGVAVAMLFISLPFIVRTVQPVLQELEKEVEEASWEFGCFQVANLLESDCTSFVSHGVNWDCVGILPCSGGVWFDSNYCFQHTISGFDCTCIDFPAFGTV
jgi:sulfate/thiosulfate transport system permease protein